MTALPLKAVISFRKFTVMALLLVLLGTLGCQLPGIKGAQADDWQRFYHPAGGFSALLPGKPEVTTRNYTQDGFQFTEHKLHVTKDGFDFRVLVTPIPKGFQFDLKLLGENAANNFSSHGMTIVQKSFEEQDGREVLNILVKNDEKLNTQTRMYVDQDKYYAVIAVIPKDQSDAKVVTDFLGSVRSYVDVFAYPNNAYFKEIKSVFKKTWQPNIKLIQQHFDDKTISKGDRLTTEVGVTLDKGGALKEVVVLKSSGFDFFDQDAIQTVQKSAPFAHPPGNLMRNNELSMKWSFIITGLAAGLRPSQ